MNSKLGVTIGWLMLAAVFVTTRVAKAKDVRYELAEGGKALVGYLAEPETPGKHPAILLIHEWCKRVSSTSPKRKRVSSTSPKRKRVSSKGLACSLACASG